MNTWLRRPRRLLAAAGLALGSLVASAAVSPALADNPVVFAAASLQTALDEIAEAFRAETGIRISISYAGTSALVRQIEQGAPADVFISADIAWMDYAAEHDLIRPETRVDLLGNTLVLVAPAFTAFGLRLATDPILPWLGIDGRLAMANVEAVPVGRYGRAALVALGEWEALSRRIVEAENARSALRFVARNEAPLGIVYATDAFAEPAVRIVDTFAEDTHPPIIYPAAMTMVSSGPEATAFFDYLLGPAAGAVFVANGFTFLRGD